jgi:hypothetical protein
MNQHTLQINATPTVSKTRVVKFLRSKSLPVMKDQTIRYYLNADSRDYKIRLIRHMIAAGMLTDICKWHGCEDRKSRGQKPERIGAPADALCDRIYDEVTAIVAPVVKRLYRGSQSRWAGGATNIHIKIQYEPLAYGDSIRRWSSNGKWSGNDAKLTVAVMPAYRFHVANVPGLIDAGGMLTTHAEKIADDCWSASWIVQGRGFDLNTESGYIIRSVEGEFCHGKTEKAARAVAAKRDTEARTERGQLAQQAARAVAAKRDTEARTERGRLAQQAAQAIDANADLKSHLDLIVTLADSRAAGNCESGMQSWINLHFQGRTEATIREILNADPTNHFALRACRKAIEREVQSK